jgi:hypothetical protein
LTESTALLGNGDPVPEPVETETADSGPTVTINFASIESSIGRIWAKLDEGKVVAAMPDDEKAKVLKAIEPIGKLYLEMTTRTI